MRDADIYDTKHCPRCGEPRLRPVGYIEDSKGGGPGGNHYSCLNCQGWFLNIELKRTLGTKRATFKGLGGAA